MALLWTDNSANEDNFQITYQPSGARSWSTATAAKNATSYTVGGLSASTTYIFYVRACNVAGCSAWSNGVQATTKAAGAAATAAVEEENDPPVLPGPPAPGEVPPPS